MTKHWISLAVLIVSVPSLADNDKPLPVTFGGFVDTYYAYDFNSPQDHDRAFTTQPARHNEFNVNLAYLEAKVSEDRVRGRLALQAGTSVQANYAAEPTSGQISGPTLARHIQEAVVGYRLLDRLWIDAGIYLSHLGFESWISKDNWTYTRSLVAEFSPYYQAGVKLGYQWDDRFYTCVHVINGWQNISENNGNKALGLQAVYTPSGAFSLTYNNFYGTEAGARYRFFNDFIAKAALTDDLQVAAVYDVGVQQNAGGASSSVWQGYGAFIRRQLTPKLSVTVRGEGYQDRNQVIAVTNTPNGFQVLGASLNTDVALHKQVLWRTELRGLWSRDGIFPGKTGAKPSDGFLVSSLALSF